MQTIIKDFHGNPAAFMRSKGYAFDRRSFSKGGLNELSFVRRITGQEFPRFHAYIKQEIVYDTGSSRAPEKRSLNLIINLHLDQKRPSYGGGSSAHAGEYGGELIREELERFKQS